MAEQSSTKRVFVSDVDRYSSRHIAEFLSKCVASEEEEEEEEEGASASPEGEPAFQVVGTVSSPSSSKDEARSFLLEEYTAPTRDELFERLLECDVVVYNISEPATQHQLDEATWAVTALHAELDNFKSPKIFILVSTVMTRAVTKPQNLDEDDVILTEEDFKRRRPHPNFKNHNNLEKHVLKLGRSKRSKFTSYVIASGHQYGKGENLFHYFFKVSWLMQFPKVPIFGQGTNCIPMIHVYDLAGVIQKIIELRPKPYYLIAVDDSKDTLEEIVRMISKKLGPGKIEKFPREEAIAMKAFQPEEVEYLSINLRLDSFIIKDSMNLLWKYESGMFANIERIVEEYKDARQLLPIRICVVGPPAVGKTTVAEKLCSHYQIHHIKIKEVIEEKIAKLTAIVNGGDPDIVGPEAAVSAKTQLEDVTKSMETNSGRLADHVVFDMLQEKLNSNPCRNQGFVLDGYPKSYEQAELIFYDESADNPDEKYKKPVCNKRITPEHVFALDASDDFLKERVMGLPESVAEKMRVTQQEFVPRLMKYRQRVAAEETLLDYFDELEIHPEYIEVTTDDPEYTDVIRKITEIVGVPKNYGLSPEEQEEVDRKNEHERKHKLAALAAERKQKNEAALAEMTAEYEEWEKNLSEVKRQESELLEVTSLPLRNYLMKYVIPSLTEAMVECCKIKPEDPIDFLAEHLLRSNQQD
ncbi:hypothetical protein Q5P01_004694 [Channa striata]|uniref:Uncharacterized protein n=1 Tax=Channa striata TaxID=64152 RepID=A0AA88NBN6_CHASR|nr:hypothetical protein Q5P01_004694 [Channa striata]